MYGPINMSQCGRKFINGGPNWNMQPLLPVYGCATIPNLENPPNGV